MKHLSIALGAITLLLPCHTIQARGRGGGISPGGGGGNRAAAHAPSMSRANMARPNVSRPSMPSSRPSLPSSRPNLPSSRPNMPSPTRPNIPNVSRPNIPNVSRPDVNRPATRPGFPETRPNLPDSRPNLPGTRPNLPDLRPGGGDSGFNRPAVRPGAGGGDTRPNFPDRPGAAGTRPNFPGPNSRPGTGLRPSPGDISDFLDLPGRPGTKRSGNRLPDMNRPNWNSPNINRPTLNQTDIRNRITGGNNVNIGNIDIDFRNNNITQIRNRWTNVNTRPFDRNFWIDPGFNRIPSNWRWQGSWGRYPRYWCWTPNTWATCGAWFTWTWAKPIQFNYGTNIIYRDKYVYVNDQQVATTTAYYEQAAEIATNIPESAEPENTEWLPLGVYAITDPEGNDTDMLLQLAVSKEGIIAGTFYNDTVDTGRPVEGTVDRETQRAAWRFADEENEDLVMEAGIYELTQDETSALLHFDKTSTQTWLLVRLPEPKDE